LLRAYGATVDVDWGTGDHSITAEQVDAAREWLVRNTSPTGHAGS
jgi:predicted esterase